MENYKIQTIRMVETIQLWDIFEQPIIFDKIEYISKYYMFIILRKIYINE